MYFLLSSPREEGDFYSVWVVFQSFVIKMDKLRQEIAVDNERVAEFR